MSDCPHCHQTIDPQAVVCPYCRTTLKAYGHPGMPLHRATGVDPLCLTCTYHEDDTCTYPQRPHARECMLYSDRNITQFSDRSNHKTNQSLYSTAISWAKRHTVWLALIGLGVISFLIALSS
ncbi:MAG: zinc ribbon domain-containing protein [Leptolyngbyaceae bacterium]|nr:zinc ribbon domain-containing protein [Leptolyngbyaceae bacterium]